MDIKKPCGEIIDSKTANNGVFVKTKTNTEMGLAISNKSLDVCDILEYIKQTKHWKIMTRKRLLESVYEAYMLGRDNIIFEKSLPSNAIWGVLPRVKNKGNNENFYRSIIKVRCKKGGLNGKTCLF